MAVVTDAPASVSSAADATAPSDTGRRDASAAGAKDRPAPANGASSRKERRERKQQAAQADKTHEPLRASDGNALPQPPATNGAVSATPSAETERPPPRRKAARDKSPDGKSYTEDIATPERFLDAAWFSASSGDLRFAQWLFGRSQGTADVSALQDAAMLARVHALYALEKRVQSELQMRSTSRSADAESGDDVDAAVEDDELLDDAAEPAPTDTWPPARIVDDAERVLRVSRLALWTREQEQARKRSSEPKLPKRSLERTLVKELVENTTELLLCRAGYDDIPVLERWMAFLSLSGSDLQQELEEAVETLNAAAAEAPEANENATAAPSKREQKRQRKSTAKDAEATASAQLSVAIAFLRECHALESSTGDAAPSVETPQSRSPASWPAMSEQSLAHELERIYYSQRINDVDEARRVRLTQDLQQVFRRRQDNNKWRKCDVILFGSSLSLFGATNSDLDMCLIMKTGAETSAGKSQKMVGARELRALLSGKASASGAGLDLVALHELRFQVQKSVEKITHVYHDVNKRDPPLSRGQLQQLQQLRFFRAHYRLLQDAIDDRVAALSSGDDNGTAAAAVAQAAAARMKELVAKSRRQSDDLFRVRAMLERANCRVRMVISGARIPIIRFTHVPTALECDLCFENVLATRNTFLLRAYASFDERARVLGMAIKHWAKQRAINDASMGFLSSYSFVLLSVYFLQAAARVLPNLQDPALLSAANVPPSLYNGVNIAFCTDTAAAQQFHTQQLSARGESASSASVATLLVWFFEFYASQFDFANRVVAVRTPDTVLDKRVVWGLQQARSWRMSLQDPLETTRDLGCVLQFKGQEQILREFKRAHAMLRDGESFSAVASSDAPAAPETPQQQRAGGKRTRAAAAANKENVRNGAAAALAKPNASDKSSKSGKSDKPTPRQAADAGGNGKQDRKRSGGGRKTDRSVSVVATAPVRSSDDSAK